MLLDAGWPGKSDLKILCGGEALHQDLAERLLQSGRELWNMYGPTETTIWSLVERVKDVSQAILIGRPIANTDVFICDKGGQPVPVGVRGELIIGGDGVAHGYHNRPNLTLEKFISSPFSQGAARLYKTGDLARYHPDGRIECLGRIDSQVKVRGFRIELGEIESVLAEQPAIAQNVVVLREDSPGDKRIVAYVVPAVGAAFDLAATKHRLRELLPDYMVPSDFVALPSLPLTPNKKVDRRSLPAPVRDGAFPDSSYVAPRSPVEETLCRMWAEILGLSRVGIHDDFFELGGHSLLAVRLLARILESWPYQQLTIAAFLQSPTVAEFAALLQSGKQISTACVIAFRKSGTRPPFFCLPGAGGNVVSLRPLALSISKDQPFYCLQAKRLDGSDPFKTVEQAATFYLDEIRTVQPHGPYFLGGACFGGLVAFEMARMLREQNQKIGLLALIDTYNFAFGRTLAKPQLIFANARFFLRRIHHHFESLKTVPWKKRMSYLAARMQAIRYYISDLLSVAKGGSRNQLPAGGLPVEIGQEAGLMQNALNRATQASLEAARVYMPKHYDGEIVLFKASDRIIEPYQDDALGWRPFADHVEVNEIEGTHTNIASPPRVHAISSRIEAAIESYSASRDPSVAALPIKLQVSR